MHSRSVIPAMIDPLGRHWEQPSRHDIAVDETHALEADQGMEWLAYWNEGEFDICRRNWPEAPAECYIGADPCLVTARPEAKP